MGVTQVVNLGAGFDTRAYRVHERFPAVRFFELDLPGTTKAKQDRVAAVFGRLPDYVVFVPTNFDAEPLERALGRAGYDPAQRTFFIWEGVTMCSSARRRTIEEAAALVARHGLTVVSDLGPRELTERYLIGSDGRPDGRMAEFARVMHASVAP